MPELPAFLRTLQGSGVGYLLAAACIAGLLILRVTAKNPSVRRRSTVAAALFLLFALVRLPLVFEMFPPTVLDLKGQVVANPPFQILNVLSLIIFALALILGLMVLLVDVVLVGRLKMEIPRILSDVALIAVFLLSVMLILYYETDLNITGLFTTAGVLSIVIGLALQDTLGNVFAGLALQMERPFKVGDWISFGQFEGVVHDVSWRATQFRTRNNDLVTVPNSTISKESFINYSSPSRVSGRLVEIGVHYRHPPAEVKHVLLEACAQVSQILTTPSPLVRLKSFDAYTITYQVKFWIDDFTSVLDIEEAYRSVVWYAFQREGVEIPFPIQIEYQHEYQHSLDEEEKLPASERILDRLRQVEFLQPLSSEELELLAKRTKMHSYYTNETIIRQGDEGGWFFLLDEGEVIVYVSKEGREQEVARLGPPGPFGEMALLTGERRTATVKAATPVRLLVIDRESFKSTIVSNPNLAAAMSDIVARRQVELLAKQEALDKSLAAAQAETSRQILESIRRFFGFAHARSTQES
jgi:small-conductance mechanosensitive channel/CRP-like cAMP-binding protein